MTTSGARAGLPLDALGLPLDALGLATVSADTSASGVSRPTGGQISCTVHPRDLRHPSSIRPLAQDEVVSDPAFGCHGRSA